SKRLHFLRENLLSLKIVDGLLTFGEIGSVHGLGLRRAQLLRGLLVQFLKKTADMLKKGGLIKLIAASGQPCLNLVEQLVQVGRKPIFGDPLLDLDKVRVHFCWIPEELISYWNQESGPSIQGRLSEWLVPVVAAQGDQIGIREFFQGVFHFLAK